MKNSRAFTLIELLVVVLIIGILAAVAVPQYQKAVEKSRSAEAIIFVKNLSDAEKIFYLANGQYTNDFSQLDVGVESSDSNYETKDWKYMLKTDEIVPRITASRRAYTENERQYNLGYDLLNNEFFCSANRNTKGVEFCKTFAVAARACNHSAGDPCYYF